MGHVVHCHLIATLLAGGDAHDRFMQKMSHFEATLDHEEEGGIGIDNPMDNENDAAAAVKHPAIQPEFAEDQAPHAEAWPAPSAQAQSANGSSNITPGMSQLSLEDSASGTLADSGAPSQSSTRYVPDAPVFGIMMLHVQGWRPDALVRQVYLGPAGRQNLGPDVRPSSCSRKQSPHRHRRRSSASRLWTRRWSRSTAATSSTRGSGTHSRRSGILNVSTMTWKRSTIARSCASKFCQCPLYMMES